MTRTVKAEVPAIVGVPESRPAAERVRPAGRLPAVSAKPNGDDPALALSDWLYATPRVALGSAAGSTAIAGHETVSA